MMTEDLGFMKDETPYYVFACWKCQQYSYVKTTQKTKKCLRCGRFHLVKNIATLSEVINGITAAKDRVITLQDELARRELGYKPAFRANNDFSLVLSTSKEPKDDMKVMLEHDEVKNSNFEVILRSLHEEYRKFPRYLIELTAQDKGVSKKEIQFLITKFLHEGLLKKNIDGLYSLRN